MILSAYERPDSPWVRIQYADATGKKRFLKTSIRKTDPDKATKIAIALNKVEAQLLSKNARQTGGGWTWVPMWLSVRYASKESTLRVYEAHWKWLAIFLRINGLSEPGMVEREHCFAYAQWRQAEVKEKSGRSPGINTAIGELKTLGMILEEALKREMITSNPARKLGIEREETEPRPEMTDSEILIILEALKKEPAWMQRSWFLALNTGLRFSSTQLQRTQVQLERGQIVIEKPKGGRKRAFAIAIYPEIEPMIRRFMESDARELWSLPREERTLVGLTWNAFFKRLKLPHLCFSCTRVTFITRGAMAGVPEAMMMKLVNHASKEVHRIYQRMSDGNALRFRAQIAIPGADAAIA